jgi:hypothetical protein
MIFFQRSNSICSSGLSPADAGVVEQDRDPAHGRVGLFQRLDPLVFLGDVQGEGEGRARAVGGVDLGRHGLGPGEVDVGEADLGAFLGEASRGRRAQALGPAGDEGLLAGDPARALRHLRRPPDYNSNDSLNWMGGGRKGETRVGVLRHEAYSLARAPQDEERHVAPEPSTGEVAGEARRRGRQAAISSMNRAIVTSSSLTPSASWVVSTTSTRL